MTIFYCYKITNTVNQKAYVGTASHPRQRWAAHKTDARKGKGFVLHAAMRKYGIEKFTFEVICCGVNRTDILKYVEPLLIDQHKTLVTEGGYNVYRESTGPLSEIERLNHKYRTKEGMAKPEVRQHISAAVKAHYANGGVHPMLGKKHRPESIAQMSASHKDMTEETKQKIGNKAKAMWQNPEKRAKVLDHIQNPTEKTRQKMSAAKKGKTSWNKGKENTWTAAHRSKTYLVTTPNGETLEVTNLSAFAKEQGLSQGTLHMTATGQRTSHKGYQARFDFHSEGKVTK